MDPKDTKQNNEVAANPTEVSAEAAVAATNVAAASTTPTPAFATMATDKPVGPDRGLGQQGQRPVGRDRRGGRKGPSREPRAKPEFDQKIISIRRVTRVASGGRRFTFSVAIVAGNRKGQAGVGTGKAGDTSIAIDKAFKNARKHMVKFNLTKDMSIPYEVNAKYSSALVSIRPSKKGMVAGSSVRTVLELAGIKNVTAKILSGSKNHLNIARVAIKALSELEPTGK